MEGADVLLTKRFVEGLRRLFDQLSNYMRTWISYGTTQGAIRQISQLDAVYFFGTDKNVSENHDDLLHEF